MKVTKKIVCVGLIAILLMAMPLTTFARNGNGNRNGACRNTNTCVNAGICVNPTLCINNGICVGTGRGTRTGRGNSGTPRVGGNGLKLQDGSGGNPKCPFLP